MDDPGILVIKTSRLDIDLDHARRKEIPSSDMERLLNPQESWSEKQEFWNADAIENLAHIDEYASSFICESDSVLPQLKVRMIEPRPCGSPSALRYDALSYTWHNPSWMVTPELRATGPAPLADQGDSGPRIVCPMSQNLWKIVLSEAASAGNMLWVDQVCIDQRNDVEKDVSVGFTDREYQNAERVFLAIEDISLKEEVVPSLQTLICETELTQESFAPVAPDIFAYAM